MTSCIVVINIVRTLQGLEPFFSTGRVYSFIRFRFSCFDSREMYAGRNGSGNRGKAMKKVKQQRRINCSRIYRNKFVFNRCNSLKK